MCAPRANSMLQTADETDMQVTQTIVEGLKRAVAAAALKGEL